MRNLKIGFIGLGLIGGSIAKAIKKYHEDFTIIAYNRGEAARTLALNESVCSIATDKIDSNFSDCDYIFLCTPVEQNISYLKALKAIIKKDCIITDVGSVKSNIHEEIIALDMEANFIGGHPMAGSEKTGYANASPSILENAYYAITKTKLVDKKYVDELYELVESIKAIPVKVDYKEHDFAVAAISHVPHIIAATLVNLVKDNDSQDEIMKLLAAGGFKDITRIASSSPEMWQQICSTNKANIVNLIDKYILKLEEAKAFVNEEGSLGVYKLFEESRDYRDSFADKSSGPIKKAYKFYCDIEDESGAISKIAALLSSEKVNIKNMTIINNREFDNGVLQLDFYDEKSLNHGSSILEKSGYKIYKI